MLYTEPARAAAAARAAAPTRGLLLPLISPAILRLLAKQIMKKILRFAAHT